MIQDNTVTNHDAIPVRFQPTEQSQKVTWNGKELQSAQGMPLAVESIIGFARMSFEEASQSLMKKPNGNFCVRTSSDPECLTMSQVFLGQIIHQRFKKEEVITPDFFQNIALKQNSEFESALKAVEGKMLEKRISEYFHMYEKEGLLWCIKSKLGENNGFSHACVQFLSRRNNGTLDQWINGIKHIDDFYKFLNERINNNQHSLKKSL